MGKISTGNLLDPQRSGPLTVEEFGVVAAEVVAKLARMKPQKWQYGVKLSDRRSQGADVVLTMNKDELGLVTAKFGSEVIGSAMIEVENRAVKRSEGSVAAVSQMLQSAAASNPEILNILQQL